MKTEAGTAVMWPPAKEGHDHCDGRQREHIVDDGEEHLLDGKDPTVDLYLLEQGLGVDNRLHTLARGIRHEAPGRVAQDEVDGEVGNAGVRPDHEP